MIQLNSAQFAQTASKTLGMVLHVTCDINAGSLNLHKLDAIKGVSPGSIDELRFSGAVMLIADGSVLSDREALRTAMTKLDFELEEDEALGAEAILFDKGQVVGRIASPGVQASELL